MSHAVTDVPNLPPGFADTFESRYVRANGITLHVVVGGKGRPLLLLPGWPQFWYCWRLVMPQLAEHFAVIAPDLRGLGGSDKPESGYDAATLAADVDALMSELGPQRYSVAGFDLGMMVGYTLAADHPDKVERLILAEAALPGISPSPPLMSPPELNERVWHFAFNRLATINELMVAGREEIYFGHQFETKAASPDAIPQEAIDVYVDNVRDPSALRASFEYYRNQQSAEQLAERAKTPLAMPVLALGGELSRGQSVEETVRTIADDVTGAVLPGVGHYLPEEAPEALLELMNNFLRA